MRGRPPATAPVQLAGQHALFGELPTSPRHLREDERRLLERLPDAGTGQRNLAPGEQRTGRTLARRGLVKLFRMRGLAGFTIELHACRTAAGRDAIGAP